MKTVAKIVSPILLICLYYSVFTSRLDCLIYDQVYVSIFALIILVIIPVLINFTFIFWFKNDTVLLIVVFLSFFSIIINGISIGLWLEKHEMEVYKKKGKITKGFVSSAFNSDGPRMYYTFYVKNERFESFNEYNHDSLNVGDSLDVVYNIENPEMNKALSIQKKRH